MSKITESDVFIIRCFYVLGLILWFITVWYLRLYETDLMGLIILSLPIFVFIVGFTNAGVVSKEMEDEIFHWDQLSIALIIIFPLISTYNRDWSCDVNQFRRILTVGVIFSMLALLDFWVTKEWLKIMYHVKAIFQTLAVVTLIFTLYLYFLSYSYYS